MINERIKDLIAQCTETWDDFDPYNGYRSGENFNQEKFAELIIRECARVCEHRYSNNHKDNSEGAFEAIACSDAILEHFGVEE